MPCTRYAHTLTENEPNVLIQADGTKKKKTPQANLGEIRACSENTQPTQPEVIAFLVLLVSTPMDKARARS